MKKKTPKKKSVDIIKKVRPETLGDFRPNEQDYFESNFAGKRDENAGNNGLYAR